MGVPPQGLLLRPWPVKATATFELGDFDEDIQEVGLECVWEQAAVCPCRSVETDQPSPVCKHCGGSGWLYHTPTEIRCVFAQPTIDDHSMVIYGDWDSGDALITPRSEIVLGYRDRVTAVNVAYVVQELVPKPEAGPLVTRFPIVGRTVNYVDGGGDVVEHTHRVTFLGYINNQGVLRVMTEGVDYDVASNGTVTWRNQLVPPVGQMVSVSYMANPSWIVVTRAPYPLQESKTNRNVDPPERIHLPRTVKGQLDYLGETNPNRSTRAPDIESARDIGGG